MKESGEVKVVWRWVTVMSKKADVAIRFDQLGRACFLLIPLHVFGQSISPHQNHSDGKKSKAV